MHWSVKRGIFYLKRFKEMRERAVRNEKMDLRLLRLMKNSASVFFFTELKVIHNIKQNERFISNISPYPKSSILCSLSLYVAENAYFLKFIFSLIRTNLNPDRILGNGKLEFVKLLLTALSIHMCELDITASKILLRNYFY